MYAIYNNSAVCTLVLTIHDHSLYTEPTLYCDDEMTELQKEQLRTEQEQKDDMTQDIDIIKTRQGVERKDVGIQFSYLQPVSGTIMLHHCNGM